MCPTALRGVSFLQILEGGQRREALPFRLYTGLLPRPVWDWLRVELAVSPALWVELTPGDDELLPVLVTDLDPVSDHLAGQYSLSVELQTPPVEGLRN